MRYTITIRDHANPRVSPLPTYSGDFTADTPEAAATEAQEYYASELDTFPDAIEIVSIIAKS